MNMNNDGWIKASKSIGGDACVELRKCSKCELIELRDSKDPDGPTLVFTPKELDAFIDGAKRGEFDHFINRPWPTGSHS